MAHDWALMAKDSKIEWTHHTFNPWWGCERVSPACKNCYAEALARRFGMNLWIKGAPRRMMSNEYWRQPLAWNKAAATTGKRARVFCASMADVFEDREDLNEARARLWRLISETPELDWLLLTKRPQHVARMVPWGNTWPRNVWLGTTAENQRWAERRVPLLLEHPAAVSFLSCEPLLGPINLNAWLGTGARARGVGWVIVGGESGHRARPMNPEWVRALRDQCYKHGVPFFFKRWGSWRSAEAGTNGHAVRNHAVRNHAVRNHAARNHAGRLLDGQEHNGLPMPMEKARLKEDHI